MQENWFLKNIHCLKDNFIEQFKNKHKLNVVLDVLIYVFFILSFFSIPVCSFNPSLYNISWVLTLLLLGTIILNCLLFYGFRIDIISGGLILFCFSAVISSALNGFQGFVITPMALVIVTAVIYTYLKQNKKTNKYFLISVLLADILFLLTFIIVYRKELLSFDFERLGRAFGNQNYIALFMLLGFSLSSYLALFKGKVVFKILLAIMALAFLFCSLSTGSKISIVMAAIIVIVLLFMLFGKKRWWLSLLVSLGVIAIGTLIILFVPAFATIKERFISFLNEIFNISIPGGKRTDSSTSNRWFMFVNGMDLWLRKPFFGWGINGFSVFGGYNGGWSHNNISETFCNFGLFGTICFHLGFVYSIIGYRKQKNRSNNIYLLILIFFIVSMIEVALDSQKVYAYTIPVIFGGLCLNTPIINIRNIRLRRTKNNYDL